MRLPLPNVAFWTYKNYLQIARHLSLEAQNAKSPCFCRTMQPSPTELALPNVAFGTDKKLAPKSISHV